jgi:SAM-dependent methyltransferase
MKDLSTYYEVNKKKWNELAEIHFKGDGYNVKSFIEKRSGLYPLEIREVGDVNNKSLLHLQCHFGKDTLSWNLRGAKPVVGVDFSEKAISFANELANKMKIDAKFIHCNIYDLKNHLDEKFDIVYCSYGAIPWLHDLKKWAELVSYYLKPGGFFYIVDAHPTAFIFDNDPNNDITVKYSYFKKKEPIKFEEDGSYADTEAKLENITEYSWNYSVSEIINSLIKAGLKIEFFNEHIEVPWKLYDMLEEKGGDWWIFPETWKGREFPLLFSLKAKKN